MEIDVSKVVKIASLCFAAPIALIIIGLIDNILFPDDIGEAKKRLKPTKPGDKQPLDKPKKSQVIPDTSKTVLKDATLTTRTSESTSTSSSRDKNSSAHSRFRQEETVLRSVSTESVGVPPPPPMFGSHGIEFGPSSPILAPNQSSSSRNNVKEQPKKAKRYVPSPEIFEGFEKLKKLCQQPLKERKK